MARTKLTKKFIPQYSLSEIDELLAAASVPSSKLSGFTDTSNEDWASDTKIASAKAVKSLVDAAVAGLLDYRGIYDASAGTYPTVGGSGTTGAIQKGDVFLISVAGTISGQVLAVGDWLVANVDAPGQASTKWDHLEANIGYTPEDSANKVTAISAGSTDVQYPSAKAVHTGLNAKVDKNAAITAATKTKITYDAKGLVTAGTDATTADIADSLDKRYVTDAQKTNIHAPNSDAETATSIGAIIAGSGANASPADTDLLGVADVSASNVLTKTTIAELKTLMKTYLDTYYVLLSVAQSITGAKTFNKDALLMKGSGTGTNMISNANASASNYTNTLPAKSGTFAMTSDLPTVHTYKANEALTASGAVGSKTTTLANTPVAGTVTVYINGVAQVPTDDYTITGAVITFVGWNLENIDISSADYKITASYMH